MLSAPNVITLSCKSRPPRRPLESGTTAAATNTKWQERTAAGVTRACSSEPPEGGSAAEPRLGGFCQLVRVVGRRLRFARLGLVQQTRASEAMLLSGGSATQPSRCYGTTAFRTARLE